MKISIIDYKTLTINEHKDLLCIRNEEHIRNASHNKKKILLDEHLNWVQNIDNTKNYYAIKVDDLLIGGLNYNYINKEKPISALWGLFFAEKTKPMLAFLSTCQFLDLLFFQKKLQILYSEILIDNTEGYKFNTFLGVKKKEQKDNCFIMELKKEDWIVSKNNIHVKRIIRELNNIEFQEIRQDNIYED